MTRETAKQAAELIRKIEFCERGLGKLCQFGPMFAVHGTTGERFELTEESLIAIRRGYRKLLESHLEELEKL